MKFNFPIVAIGASAGGLSPLEAFFDSVNTQTKAAFVVIQHLAPNHKSLMDELLSRHTKLPIKKIEDGMPLEQGVIYLNPPKKFVSIDKGKFKLRNKEQRKLSFPISQFFKSLAEEAGQNSCAIVFSGTGSDGSEGIKYIKEEGGLVLVQDPEESKFNGMPKNAVASGVVDKVCSVDEMHKEIDSFFKNISILDKKEFSVQEQNETIEGILNLILDNSGVNFQGYKRSTILRRVKRRMSILGMSNLTEYYDYFKSNSSESQLLSREILIGVTRFFRNESAFQYLRRVVIPKLIEDNRESNSLRVWIPACSTGEEAYSIAILIKDHLRKNKLQYDVSIFATDLDRQSIKKAASRMFSENISAEIPEEFLSTYFIPQRNGFVVKKEIREMIIFSAHNLIQDAPFNNIDLISCRNLLIYLNSDVQEELFTLFQYSLRDNGVLFIGKSETVGKYHDRFDEFDSSQKFFINKEKKKFINRTVINQKNLLRGNSRDEIQPITRENVVQNKNSVLSEIQHTLIQEYVPDSVIVDEDLNLIHTSGNANQWLKLPSGELNANFLKMLPENVSLPLEVVVESVLSKGEPTVLEDIPISESMKPYFDGDKSIKIVVRKKEFVQGSKFLLITFEHNEKSTSSENVKSIKVSQASKEKIDILERELRIKKESLQTTIEELESSNEELQASNEELQSSNEELESVNEELYTVNDEYQQKNIELSEMNDDLDNLIKSTDIALLFLDDNLNIRRYTPAIKEILDLVPHDIGRNISHFRGKIHLNNFIDQIEGVLESLIPSESKVRDNYGNEYLLKISPFRTNNNEIKGVVVVFVDLSMANQLESAISQRDARLEDLRTEYRGQDKVLRLIEYNLRDLICIVDQDGVIEYCTPSAKKLTKFNLTEFVELNFFDHFKDADELTELKSRLKGIRTPSEQVVFQFEFNRKDGKSHWLEAVIKEIEQVDPEKRKYLFTIRDVHNKIKRIHELRKMSLIAEQTGSSVIITDVNGEITFANKAFEKLTLFERDEVLGKKPGSFLQGDDTDPEVVKQMARSIANRKSFDVNVINYNKFGNKYMVNIKAEPMYDDHDVFIGFFSIQNDITTEYYRRNEIHRLNEIINEQFEKLKDVNKSLEDFAYVASHDLKAPVRNIREMLGLLKKKSDSLTEEKRKKYFDLIISSASELNRLIENLLEYSRTGTLNEDLDTINVDQFVKETADQFSSDLKKQEGEVHFDLNVKELKVYPILFRRLLTNLISNSVKYSDDEPLIIKISCIRKDDKVKFTIQDNGVGIPENQEENIFKIFKKLNTREDSNGIGLSVCKKIAELHGGQIWVDTTAAQGATFHFEIPVINEGGER